MIVAIKKIPPNSGGIFFEVHPKIFLKSK